jgi:hypothetical protein
MTIIFNIFAVFCAGITATLYWIGLEHFYFFYYPWFDIPLHIIGGLTIGFWGVALAARRRYTPRQMFLFILLLAIAIGSVWEIFEYVSGLTRSEAGYWFDTLKDLSDDIVGSLIALGLYRFLYRKQPVI